MKIIERCLEWLSFGERRTAERQEGPYLVAHYWDGAAPKPHDIRDISLTGLYLVTEQRWYPGTLVMISLQKVGATEDDPDRTIMVNAKVVRSDAEGVGLQLMLPETPGSRGDKTFGAAGVDRKTFRGFLKRLRNGNGTANHEKSDKGQALIEYVLMLPFIFILIVNAVNFGGFFYAWITVANAARAGADYAVLAGASVGSGSFKQATATQINTMITQEVSSLPNRASLAVNVCQKFNGTTATLAGTCTAIPADAEPTQYVLMSIDVTYTYQPFIPAGFQFANLHLYATIPPTSIHRRAVMRVIQ
jgi:Flp pilus assembly protein TadG